MELLDYRNQIDTLDDEIAQLFTKRMQITSDIAAFKASHNKTTLDATREREILNRVSSQVGKELSSYSRVLFSTLFDLSRAYQSQLRVQDSPLFRKIEQAVAEMPTLFPADGSVACQGLEGAYSQLACDKLFPRADILYFKTFENVFQAVEQGLCSYGILPIENSSYGSVNAVYDLMRNYQFHIVRSLRLPIDHVLLAPAGTSLSDLREIFSHEQAFGQCGAFLKENPHLQVTICENTAVAAKKVAESGRKDAAAIASRACSSLYGLSILSDKMQDCDLNFTRFICIAKELKIFPGANRISLMLSLPHRPGALYRVLSKAAALGLNLTKLESRPVAGTDFSFLFYLDLDASVLAPGVVNFLCDLSDQPEPFSFLGNYTEL